jgi:uncharacterized membrane protein
MRLLIKKRKIFLFLTLIFFIKKCHQIIIADAPEYDLKHISQEEIERRISNAEKSRHARVNRCYMNMTKNNRNGNYYNSKKQNINYENINIYKREEIYKKPGIVLHLDRRF